MKTKTNTTDATAKVEQTPSQKEELAAYETLRLEVKKILDKLLDSISAEKIGKAVEDAGQRLKETGEHTQESVNKVTGTLKKDLLSSYKTTGAQMEEFADSAGAIFDLFRDKSGEIISLTAKAMGEWSQQFGDKLDDMLVYHSGETTHGGHFVCTACGQELTLKKPGHLPPCPKCHKPEFRRA